MLIDEAAHLERLAREWNLTLSRGALERLLTFVSRMLEWNARINLTGAKSRGELIDEHLVDSFAMTRFLSSGCSIADVGAGGGLPGVPLAVLRPDVALTMIEPRAKRVAFLRTISHELGLANVVINRCRSEELGSASFGVCASRATFSPEAWLGVARGLVKADGLVLVFANAPWNTEPPTARLVDSVSYASGSGRPRWMGAFCFT